VFYLTYGMYRDYFPLMALACYESMTAERAARAVVDGDARWGML
jgi:hypothetical protein